MKYIAFAVVSLAAICIVHGKDSFGANPDSDRCKQELQMDKAKVAAISDPAKQAEAKSHMKAARADKKSRNYKDCLSEMNAVDTLLQ